MTTESRTAGGIILGPRSYDALSTLAPALSGGGRVERARLHLAWLLRYRELVRNFVIRDLKARYKNSFLGFLWSLANPLLMMLVFTVVFTTLTPQEIPSFPVFVLSGLLAWNWCVASVIGGVYSIFSGDERLAAVPPGGSLWVFALFNE